MFTVDINYGIVGYTNFNNKNFIVTEISVNGLSAANDSDYKIELLHHKDSGWTYDATNFIPGADSIVENNNT